MARLREKYRTEIVSNLKDKFDIKNILAVPKIEKIIVNMGVGKALENKRRIECAVKDLTSITGQKPVVTKAKKSVAGFKLREGQEIGCKVTLRREKMYEFFDRLISIAMPRIRDFRGLSTKSFDGRGNYSLGITDQSVFPEINIDKMEFYQGMNITFVVKNSDNKKSLEMLKLFGMPFKSE